MKALFVAALMVILTVPAWAQYGGNSGTIYSPGSGSYKYFYQDKDGSGYIYDPSIGGTAGFQYMLGGGRNTSQPDRSFRKRYQP